MSRFGREQAQLAEPSAGAGLALRPFFFDVLHVDGQDLIDEPLRDRLAALEEVAGPHRIPGVVTADRDEAEAFLEETVRRGHEGVMVKGIDSPYQAGRRGKA